MKQGDKYTDVARPEAREFIWQDRMPGEFQLALQELYRELIKPLGLGQGTRRAVIIPDEQLYWVPWPALDASADAEGAASKSERINSLFQTLTVLVAPSALLMEKQAEAAIQDRYLAVASVDRIQSDVIKAALGDVYLKKTPPALPPLSSARQEIADVQELLGPRMQGTGLVISGQSAGDEVAALRGAMEALRSASIVHLAAHGLFNPNNPMASAIFLSPSNRQGVIRPADLASTDLSAASLVSLSACQTGLADIRRGGEAIGFVRGVLLGGAKRVLLTSWTVEDRPTQQFFRELYTRIAQGGSYADAYQGAVLASARRYRHPFYWAGYAMFSSTPN